MSVRIVLVWIDWREYEPRPEPGTRGHDGKLGQSLGRSLYGVTLTRLIVLLDWV